MKADSQTLRKAALVSGLGFFVILLMFIFTNFLVLGNLFELGDGTATAQNIAGNQLLFRSGIAAFLLLTIADIVVAWGLYVFLKPVSKTLSSVSAIFRLIATAVLASAITNLVNVENLINSGRDHTVVADQVDLFANGFMQGWQVGLVFYGIHLLLTGYMALKSGYMPNWLGVLVAIAGLGYVYDGFASAFTSGEAALVANITFVGEVLLIFWLLIMGSRTIKLDIYRKI